MPYDEHSIKILTTGESEARFHYRRVQELCSKYPLTSPDIIAALVEACQLTNYPLEKAVKRYLDKDTSVPMDYALVAAYRAIRTR